MANTHVFPGGVISDEDFRHDHVQTPSSRFPACAGRENADAGFRVAALRETFEETGLIFSDEHERRVEEIRDLQFKVKNDPGEFSNLLPKESMPTLLRSLHQWTNWLTPSDIKRRFDTMMYVKFMDDPRPAPSLDASEITSCAWLGLNEALSLGKSKKILLPPPQFYEILTLRDIMNSSKTWEEFQKNVMRRSELLREASIRWLVVRVKTKDGEIGLLPGDDMYPEFPVEETRDGMEELAITCDEAREKCVRLHRLEGVGIKDFCLIRFLKMKGKRWFGTARLNSLLCFAGALVSSYGLYTELRKEADPDYAPLCDLHEYISCSKAFDSKFGKGFGIVGPLLGEDSSLNQYNSLYGIISYSLLFVIGKLFLENLR
ncbi:unnamed protein product [Notodromas monacha]|uniref:vitamin-K-epoxide reductase (warfarin-sensitive) n=1 Tax=Notodromas monacha TaxID=399045 RepID=A0A7R9BUJ1_9CRUS|nr:unnamed protein product [Notodromas monacha]CAG0921642.1 unnamed protein product [Notodromas monacha]